ncbi:hypothetical protein [Actinoplanes sp. TBRC 11911]|nr:hypothetical protein [Actinoplanes sp. TBRC 11911]
MIAAQSREHAAEIVAAAVALAGIVAAALAPAKTLPVRLELANR